MFKTFKAVLILGLWGTLIEVVFVYLHVRHPELSFLRAFQKYIICLAFLAIFIYVKIWVCVYLGFGKYGLCENLDLCKFNLI